MVTLEPLGIDAPLASLFVVLVLIAVLIQDFSKLMIDAMYPS
jgi:hypothetical protein